MKVYQVCKAFYDGDHNHGMYQSPLFARREDADAFLRAVWDEATEGQRWWTDCGMGADYGPMVHELVVMEGPVTPVEEARIYRTVIYT